MASTFSRPVLNVPANTIVPFGPHAPPRGDAASQITCGGLPCRSDFFSFPSAKNASSVPSGDQKGRVPPSLPVSLVGVRSPGRASTATRLRCRCSPPPSRAGAHRGTARNPRRPNGPAAAPATPRCVRSGSRRRPVRPEHAEHYRGDACCGGDDPGRSRCSRMGGGRGRRQRGAHDVRTAQKNARLADVAQPRFRLPFETPMDQARERRRGVVRKGRPLRIAHQDCGDRR